MGETPMTFGARLLLEFDSLRELSSLGSLLYTIVVLASAWAVARVGPALVHVGWRLGVDPRRRLGLLATGSRLTGLAIAVFGLLRPLAHAAPTLTALASLLALALAALIAPVLLHNLASALALATRTRLREGDLIRIGTQEGTVRDITLLHVDLRTIDGGITHIPATDFDRQPVTVSSRRAAVPVTARIAVGPELAQADIDRVRAGLWLCVYRRADTPVRIEHDPHTGQLEVRIDTWARTAVAEVERHVHALLIELTTRRASEPEPAPEVT